jgi:hypothetical protein
MAATSRVASTEPDPAAIGPGNQLKAVCRSPRAGHFGLRAQVEKTAARNGLGCKSPRAMPSEGAGTDAGWLGDCGSGTFPVRDGRTRGGIAQGDRGLPARRSPRRADRVPGSAGPVGGLLGGKDPTGRLLVSVYTFAELAFSSAINKGIAFSKLPR